MKIACIRLDKLGDLAVTLPADSILNQDNEVYWFISNGLGTLCEKAKPKRSFFEIKIDHPTSGFKQIIQVLKAEKFDMAIIYFAPWWVSLALFLCGVPQRVGRRSQWWSYLFLNKGLRQKRSQSQKHELQYNEELSFFAIGKEVIFSSSLEERGLKLEPYPSRHVLEKLSLTPQSYYVVHPGMRGSALNWSQNSYAELILDLSKKHPVIITGTQVDLSWLLPIKKMLPESTQIIWALSLFDLNQLLYILKSALFVVAPSTGISHLAASLGVPLVALYPSHKAQSYIRWRPLGDKVTLLVSDQESLSSIKVTDVLQICLKSS